jgi:hypothetical protein
MNKLKYLILTVIIPFGANTYAAKMPACWLKSSACTQGNFLEKQSIELDESVDQIFDFKSNLVESIAEKEKKGKKYYLASLKTEIGVEVEGGIGIIESGGEAAIELVWSRKKPQHKFLSKEQIFENEYFEDENSSLNSLDLSASDGVENARQKVEYLAQKLFQVGKIKNQDMFVETAMGEIEKIIGLKKIMNQDPDRPWWPYKFQLELLFQAQGRLASGPTVGGGFLIKLVWNRLEKKNQFIKHENLSLKNNANNEVLNALSDEFEKAYLQYQQISANDKTFYDFNNIKIGVGVEIGGNIFVASLKEVRLHRFFINENQCQILWEIKKCQRQQWP